MFELILLPVLISGAAILAHVHQKPPERSSILTVKASQHNQEPTFTDINFADDSVRGGIYGLLLGTLAIEKSQNPDVRKFAEKTVQANQMIIIELTAIAERKGISTAKTLERDQHRNMQQLSQLSGPGFDSKFLIEAAAEYRKKLRTFEREIEAGKDRELQKFASDALARVRALLKPAASFMGARITD